MSYLLLNWIGRWEEEKDMKRETKRERHIREVMQYMGAYPDFIGFISGTTKSLAIQCKMDLILKYSEEYGDILLKDLITEFNHVEQVHYTAGYKGTFKSKKEKDFGKYVRRFRKEVIEGINRRYDSGFGFVGMKREDLLKTMEVFFAMLLS